MMWYAGITKALSGVFGWLLAAAAAAILGTGVALWYTSARLSETRDRLAATRAEIRQCVAANESAARAVDELVEAARHHAELRAQALQAQRAAAQRIRELDAQDDTAQTIVRVVRIADGDACAGLPIPERLRAAASGGD